MAVEERVSYLEAKMEDVSVNIAELKGAIAALDRKMDLRFVAIIGGLFGIVTTLL